MNFLKSVINLLPAIIGTAQALLPIVKEILVDVVRLIALLPILWSVDEPIIQKIDDIYKKVYDAIEKFKNAILLVK